MRSKGLRAYTGGITFITFLNNETTMRQQPSMVYLNEATANLMDQMMKVDIFHPLEKLRMLKDDEKTFLDPNVIMDERHRALRENFHLSSAKRSALAEAKRLFEQEGQTELCVKKQQRFFERELRRFETELRKTRPKFSGPYSCKKRNLALSDDENFWETFKRTKNKIGNEGKSTKYIAKYKKRINIGRKKSIIAETTEEKDEKKMEQEEPCIGSIKVTIKDKANFESQIERLNLLRKYFDALKRNTTEEQRIREIKTKIQQNTISKITRKYFNIWRTRAKCKKNAEPENVEIEKDVEEQKIELFINAITERQKELMKSRKTRNTDGKVIAKEASNASSKKKNIHRKHVVETPAQNRLNAQKRIIERQRAKLDEQNRIIEELKLKQMQQDIARANKETVNIAKETFTYLGQKTKRTLIHLMQQSGYRDESLMVPRQPPAPPKFLLRMEARAEARRNRVKLAEETRRMKLEEQRRKEEAARIEKEETKRRLQREALAEARKLKRQREEHRTQEIERFQKLNSIADEFYRKQLLRRCIMEPLMELVELKRINMKLAEDHYQERLIRKIFTAWETEAEDQRMIKIKIAESIYNNNLTKRVFDKWRQTAKEGILKHQVASDYYDTKLSDMYFKLWRIRIVELKAEQKEKEKVACSHCSRKLKARYFSLWRKYVTIVEDIKESEKKKEELRQLVQKVIPDFDPKQRGVALED